jgi:hypothetical protein
VSYDFYMGKAFAYILLGLLAAAPYPGARA